MCAVSHKHINRVGRYIRVICIVTCRPIAGQQLSIHIPAATNTEATILELPLLCNALYIYIYINRGRGVFYVVRINPLLGNGYIFYGSALRLYR
jgi:hypothetical protein